MQDMQNMETIIHVLTTVQNLDYCTNHLNVQCMQYM